MFIETKSTRATSRSGYRIAVVPGDGIGSEVVPAAVEVIEAAARHCGLALDLTWKPWSAARSLETGDIIPPGGLAEIEGCDAILFGAHGAPGVPDHVAAWQLLFAMRHTFDQYANLRPIRLSPGVEPRLRLPPGVDIDLAIVRENTEGEFAGPGGVSGRGTPVEQATQLTVITRYGTERIARFAFDLARTRRGHVTTVTKSNSMPHALGYWDRVVDEIAEAYPDVAHRKLYVDAAAAEFVLRPESFDVVLATTLHGDILSDLGAALTGGLGLAPSGNVNPERRFPSLFEPIHGSAPDIAGQGVANPTACMLAGAMLLEHLGEHAAGRWVRRAVGLVLREGRIRTRDLGGSATTRAFTDAVLGAVDHVMSS